MKSIEENTKIWNKIPNQKNNRYDTKRINKWSRISSHGERLLKKIESLSSTKKPTEQEKVIAVSELRQDFKLTALLKLACLAKSTYYYHIKKLNKDDKYKQIKDEILSIFHENKGRYGYIRITLELKNRRYIINHKTVLRLMNILGLKSIVRPKRKYNSYKGNFGEITNNLLKRDFKAYKQIQKWVTDVTEFRVHD